jgi:hypothetical protein
MRKTNLKTFQIQQNNIFSNLITHHSTLNYYSFILGGVVNNKIINILTLRERNISKTF